MATTRAHGALSMLAIAGCLALSSPAKADGTPNQPPPDPPPAPVVQVPLPQQVSPYPAPSGSPYGSDTQYVRRHSTPKRWYGWQTLTVDGGWILLASALGPVDGGASAGTAVAGYFLGGPIVHWSHGNVGRGFADLGIRTGAPLLLALLGYAALRDEKDGGEVMGAVGAGLGIALGGIAAVVIDASALAYEPLDDEDASDLVRARRRHAAAPFKLAPSFVPRREGGFVLGLSAAMF